MPGDTRRRCCCGITVMRTPGQPYEGLLPEGWGSPTSADTGDHGYKMQTYYCASGACTRDDGREWSRHGSLAVCPDWYNTGGPDPWITYDDPDHPYHTKPVGQVCYELGCACGDGNPACPAHPYLYHNDAVSDGLPIYPTGFVCGGVPVTTIECTGNRHRPSITRGVAGEDDLCEAFEHDPLAARFRFAAHGVIPATPSNIYPACSFFTTDATFRCLTHDVWAGVWNPYGPQAAYRPDWHSVWVSHAETGAMLLRFQHAGPNIGGCCSAQEADDHNCEPAAGLPYPYVRRLERYDPGNPTDAMELRVRSQCTTIAVNENGGRVGLGVKFWYRGASAPAGWPEDARFQVLDNHCPGA